MIVRLVLTLSISAVMITGCATPTITKAGVTSARSVPSTRCPADAARRGPFCLVRTPDETDEFNDRLELHRPDGTSVWSGWGTDVMSASETEIVLHQQWTGSMGGPIDVDKKLVLRNGVFVEVEGLKPSDVDR